eukprot:Gb_18314 [translate_table: standard]
MEHSNSEYKLLFMQQPCC